MGSWLWKILGLDKEVEDAKQKLIVLSVELWELLKGYAPPVLETLKFLVASIPLFFVGLFASVGGLDYFLLIDKASMLASLFYYTALLSSITATVAFVPSLVTNSKLLQRLGWAMALIAFLLAVIGLEHAVMLALLGACILPLVWLKWRHERPILLKRMLTFALVCCIALGYLRGEYLRDQKPSMIVQLADTKTSALVTVIMSFNQGVLVFEPPSPHPRLYPWSRIAWIGPAPMEGDGFFLKRWRDAMQSWTGAGVARLRGWLGWRGDAAE